MRKLREVVPTAPSRERAGRAARAAPRTTAGRPRIACPPAAASSSVRRSARCRTGRLLQERVNLVGGDAGLGRPRRRRSPAAGSRPCCAARRLELLARRQRVDGVDQAHAADHVAHLAALHVADEVPREAVAVHAPAWRPARRCGSRPPASRRPRAERAGRSRRRTWWPPGSRPSGPTCSRIRARFAAITAGIRQPSTPITPWRPVRPRSRRWEKYRPGLQMVHSPGHLDLLDPGPLEGSPGGTATDRHGRPARAGSPNARLQRLADVIAHLVAARARARPDRRHRAAADGLATPASQMPA